MIKIMLLDDHDIVLYGLRASIESQRDFQLLGAFSDSATLLEALRQESADVLVMDYSLKPGDLDGLNLIRIIVAKYPQCKVLVLSAHTNSSIIKIALQAGAKGYLGKDQNTDELLTAIRTVLSGRVYLSAMASAAFKNSNDSELDNQDSLLLSLSPKEREIIRCCLDGMTVTAIAEKFSRSVKTISTQKQSAFSKLGVSNDSGLFKLWHQVKAE
jgi:two-component system, NarL family, captular synthesis response regulator RcsB